MQGRTVAEPRVGKLPWRLWWFCPFIRARCLLIPKTNPRKQTSPLKRGYGRGETASGLTQHFKRLEESSYFSLQRWACVPPLSVPEPHTATFIPLCSVTAVRTKPCDRPSEELPLALREHPCNYICSKRGQILAPAYYVSPRGTISEAMCVSVLSMFCRPEITAKSPRSWRACLQGKHLLPQFKLDFSAVGWILPEIWKRDRFPFLQILSRKKIPRPPPLLPHPLHKP